MYLNSSVDFAKLFQKRLIHHSLRVDTDWNIATWTLDLVYFGVSVLLDYDFESVMIKSLLLYYKTDCRWHLHMCVRSHFKVRRFLVTWRQSKRYSWLWLVVVEYRLNTAHLVNRLGSSVSALCSDTVENLSTCEMFARVLDTWRTCSAWLARSIYVRFVRSSHPADEQAHSIRDYTGAGKQ